MKGFVSTRAIWRVAGLSASAVMLAAGFARAATVQTLYPASTLLSAVVKAADGNFYGTSRYGGTDDVGTVFRLSPTGVYQVIYSFTGGADGSFPRAALTVGPDGQLYGTCQYGGTNNAGGIFKITTSGSFTPLHVLAAATDGAEPVGGLTVGTNGMLFGTASYGGASGFGTIFRITTGGNFTVLHTFSGSDGNGPVATLAAGADGLLYGTTQFGGTNDDGTVFKITTAGDFTPLFSFNGMDGAYPSAALARGLDGALYGTTAYGGTGAFGSVFKITSGGVFVSLYSMTQENLGSNPAGGLTLGEDGNFYGTVHYGGTNGFGSIFQVTTAGGFSPLYNFTGNDDGGNPMTALARGDNYTFFGISSLGGTGGGGTFYALTLLHFDLIRRLANGQMDLQGAGGTPGGTYSLLTFTNLATEGTNWYFAGSGQFDNSGRFNLTNNASGTERLYRLQQP
ncbi:MAG TPA: choice-of-anchor tandem repeat GloVer-containing protein [Verrucomicrobiae bacterium]|nr:choice-of-anchor tandem repeat GloVer-containing protein [Verrucomicrobiae bacterium]